ncbi:SLAM family member 9 isoform X2 [Solea solea]|uniref:SLAM family member 9 isoform X2 n=1 Tax=Solea solea TaxID=90069 RepID=UPI00272CE9F9|nr:SLAM family member 9 isoform X2 [Solea solea]
MHVGKTIQVKVIVNLSITRISGTISNHCSRFGVFILLSQFLVTSFLLATSNTRSKSDVEASECPSVVHKQVGDTVVLSSCLPSEGVTNADWIYKDQIVEDLEKSQKGAQFRGRTSLNRINLSLTVRRLTLQDSGVYRFKSEVNEVQRTTVTITLHVHALLTPPILTLNSSWSASNESCTVVLDCNSMSDSNITYNWTVKSQIYSGSRLQYTIRPQEGGTIFTCTILNSIGEQSFAEKAVKCDNITDEISKGEKFPLWTVVSAGACLLLIIIVVIITVICVCKRRQTEDISQEIETEYADISDYVVDNKPAHVPSVYDFIRDHRPNQVTLMPHSVYDKIQLSRVRTPPESPYQDI